MHHIAIKNKNFRLRKVMNRLSAKFFVLAAVLATSCQKPSGLGLGIQPENDLLNAVYSDSTTLITHTIIDDSVNTKGAPVAMLGSCNDPVFGKVAASFYTQLNIKNTNNNFGNAADLVCDSIVLSLVYKDTYGSLNAQTARVYELPVALFADSSYYSHSNVGDFSSLTDIGTKTFIPKPKDSVFIEGDNQPPQLRIKLNNLVGQSFLAESGSANIATNSAFQSYFKGIYVTTTNGVQLPKQGAILSFNLSSAYSGITLYYRNVVNPDTGKFELIFTTQGESVHFNHFDHDYTSTAIDAQLSSSDTIQEALTYIQGIAGVQMKIYLPHFPDYKSSGTIAINKAEIIIKAEDTQINDEALSYPPPTRLFLEAADSTSTGFSFLPDFLQEGEAFFGGTYNATDKTYTFNIARHLQAIVTGKKDYGMYLVPVGGAFNAHRVVLGGGGSTGANKIKLHLVYTKLY